MMKPTRVGLALLALLVSASALTAQQPPQPAPQGRGGRAGQAAPTGPQLLHPMFQDHGVLQRDRPITVYGETAPNALVTVSLSQARAEARAGADGFWSAMLPPMGAGGPYTLTANGNGETRTANDVLVGDVFFCAGQSNMAFSQRQADGAEEDARTAADPQIRQLNVPANASLTPRQTFAANIRWVLAAPDTVGNFSAACYYFARELRKTVNVPVGLVVAAYGGARLRNFMGEETLRKLGLETEDLDILDLYRRDQPAGTQRWGARFESWWKATRPKDGHPWQPDFNDASWPTAPQSLGAWALWNGGTNPDGFIGQMWMRTTVTLSSDQAANTGATLDLGSVNQEDWTWVNGAFVGSSSFAGRTRYGIPAGLLKAGSNVIVTNVYCGWRDCGMRGPAETRALRFADGTTVPLANPWRTSEVPEGMGGPQLPWGSAHGVTMNFNGMVAPVGAYTVRGVVWYQGESDVNFAGRYKAMLKAMMSEWRQQFGDPALPFLIVQLPGYGPTPTAPTTAPWADLREAQRQTALEDARAALAVTVDIGNATDLHPTNKHEVGRRLATAARHLIYGERIAASGPVVASVARRGSNVVVSFRDVSSALTMRGSGPTGFELCGATEASCRWTDARIDGTSVVLPNASGATRVRYAWGGSPVCPLFDGSGLPAGPFEMVIR